VHGARTGVLFVYEALPCSRDVAICSRIPHLRPGCWFPRRLRRTRGREPRRIWISRLGIFRTDLPRTGVPEPIVPGPIIPGPTSGQPQVCLSLRTLPIRHRVPLYRERTGSLSRIALRQPARNEWPIKLFPIRTISRVALPRALPLGLRVRRSAVVRPVAESLGTGFPRLSG
jgi:hypothetical protein